MYQFDQNGLQNRIVQSGRSKRNLAECLRISERKLYDRLRDSTGSQWRSNELCRLAGALHCSPGDFFTQKLE